MPDLSPYCGHRNPREFESPYCTQSRCWSTWFPYACLKPWCQEWRACRSSSRRFHRRWKMKITKHRGYIDQLITSEKLLWQILMDMLLYIWHHSSHLLCKPISCDPQTFAIDGIETTNGMMCIWLSDTCRS